MCAQAIFAYNMAFAAAENAKGHSYTLGMNMMADLTNDEYRVRVAILFLCLLVVPVDTYHTYILVCM